VINLDKYSGCFSGLARGDTHGAFFEGGQLERLLWKVIGRTKTGKLRYTDDTQMAIDVATSFIKNNRIDQNHLATVFAKSYKWSRGYGRSATRLLKKIKTGVSWKDVNRATFSDGSYGNGAAMRAPVLAMCFPDNQKDLADNVAKCSEITHAHPLAIEGAKLIAFVTGAALHDWETTIILNALPAWCNEEIYKTKIAFCSKAMLVADPFPDSIIKKELGNGIAASESTQTAIYFALTCRSGNFQSMLDRICAMGGDTDTIGAMAGAIWGAFNGSSAMDSRQIERIENSETIITLAQQLHGMAYTDYS